jgi:hypothetical protein
LGKPYGINLRPVLGIRADFQPKSSIPIGAKVEISPNGFTLGVKAKLEKIFSICPKLLINAELYGLVLAPMLEKRIPSNLRGQFCNPWGQCFSIY